jgi:hypothetical protein
MQLQAGDYLLSMRIYTRKTVIASDPHRTGADGDIRGSADDRNDLDTGRSRFTPVCSGR